MLAYTLLVSQVIKSPYIEACTKAPPPFTKPSAPLPHSALEELPDTYKKSKPMSFEVPEPGYHLETT
jgi:hypothetical protein